MNRALVARIVAHTGVSPAVARVLVRHFADSPLVYTLRMCFDGPWRWGLCGSKKPRSRRDDLTMFARYLTRLDAGQTTEHAQRAVYGTVADLVKIVPAAPYPDDWAMPDDLVVDVADALKAEKKARSRAARLTIGELALELNVGRSTAYRIAADIGITRFASCVRVAREDLERYLRRQAPTNDPRPWR